MMPLECSDVSLHSATCALLNSGTRYNWSAATRRCLAQPRLRTPPEHAEDWSAATRCCFVECGSMMPPFGVQRRVAA